jgi:hypothetical protein
MLSLKPEAKNKGWGEGKERGNIAKGEVSVSKKPFTHLS